MTAKKLTLRELEACAAESGKKLLRTFPEMRLAFLHECGKRRINRAYALRDYYPFWKTNAERSKAGKLLLLNRRDEEHIQIMFDDNIGYGSPHIVDARDAETGQPVSIPGEHFAPNMMYCSHAMVHAVMSWRCLLLNGSNHMLWYQHLFHCTLLQQKWDAAGAIDIVSLYHATRTISTGCKCAGGQWEALAQGRTAECHLGPSILCTASARVRCESVERQNG